MARRLRATTEAALLAAVTGSATTAWEVIPEVEAWRLPSWTQWIAATKRCKAYRRRHNAHIERKDLPADSEAKGLDPVLGFDASSLEKPGTQPFTMDRLTLQLPRKRLTRWLARVVALLVSVVVALVIAEVVLRYTDVLRETDQSNASIVFHEGEHFHKLKPNLPGVPFTGVSVSSNEFGYRCRNMRLDKTVENGGRTFRVALLGDSWGFGWGLKEEDTIANQLEELWRSDPPVTTELFNFSMPGYNLRDHFHVLKHEIARFRPDYCVVLLHLNDIEIPRQRVTRQEVDKWRKRRLSFWRQPGDYLTSLKLYKLAYAKVLLPLAIRWELPNQGFVDVFKRKYDDESETFTRYREYAEKLGELIRSQEIKVAFLRVLPVGLQNLRRATGI